MGEKSQGIFSKYQAIPRSGRGEWGMGDVGDAGDVEKKRRNSLLIPISPHLHIPCHTPVTHPPPAASRIRHTRFHRYVTPRRRRFCYHDGSINIGGGLCLSSNPAG